MRCILITCGLLASLASAEPFSAAESRPAWGEPFSAYVGNLAELPHGVELKLLEFSSGSAIIGVLCDCSYKFKIKRGKLVYIYGQGEFNDFAIGYVDREIHSPGFIPIFVTYRHDNKETLRRFRYVKGRYKEWKEKKSIKYVDPIRTYNDPFVTIYCSGPGWVGDGSKKTSACKFKHSKRNQRDQVRYMCSYCSSAQPKFKVVRDPKPHKPKFDASWVEDFEQKITNRTIAPKDYYNHRKMIKNHEKNMTPASHFKCIILQAMSEYWFWLTEDEDEMWIERLNSTLSLARSFSKTQRLGDPFKIAPSIWSPKLKRMYLERAEK